MCLCFGLLNATLALGYVEELDVSMFCIISYDGAICYARFYEQECELGGPDYLWLGIATTKPPDTIGVWCKVVIDS